MADFEFNQKSNDNLEIDADYTNQKNAIATESIEEIERKMLQQQKDYRPVLAIAMAIVIGFFYVLAFLFATVAICYLSLHLSKNNLQDFPKGWLIFFTTLCVIPTGLVIMLTKFLFVNHKNKTNEKSNDEIEAFIPHIIKIIKETLPK